MAIDTITEDVLKKCCSVESIRNLSNEEKALLSEQGYKNYRLQSKNNFLGSTKEVKFFTFNLPRIETCPGRTNICLCGCYQAISAEMLKGEDRDSQVVYSRKINWFLSEQDVFVEKILSEILKKRPRLNQKIIIRIHASGDFYSKEYLEKWMKIALITKLKNKNYDFVAYTKSYIELDSVLSDVV